MLQDPKPPMNPKEASMMTHPDASMKTYDIKKIVYKSADDYVIFLMQITNNLHIVLWFQVFLSNTNNYMASSYYFYSIIVFFQSYMVSSISI